VLTTEGFAGIVNLVKIGRMTYQRIMTYTINKIIRTFKRVVFIVLAFILTGLYVVSSLELIFLLFLSDYVTLSISTDNVRYSQKPEKWNIQEIVKVGSIYGILVITESMIVLYLGFLLFGLNSDINQLHTFVFVWLTMSGYFTVLSVRERKHFWNSKPSRPLGFAIAVNSIIVFLFAIFGIPGLVSISPIAYLLVLVYAFAAILLINDPIKTFLIKWLMPSC
ncbi:MAG: plasma-membrane proton-efflux P-type ATPase, partial [Promethearchaeota archaeon]